MDSKIVTDHQGIFYDKLFQFLKKTFSFSLVEEVNFPKEFDSFSMNSF